MEPIYWPIATIVKAGLRVMHWPVAVAGEQHIPRRGAAVLAANHISYLDPVLLGYAADRRGRYVRFLAKQELFGVPVFGAMLRQMRHVPVDRQGMAGTALHEGIARLHAGDLVGVYPEATISPAFVPVSLKTGAARMAMAAGVPLVPVALWGGQRLATKWHPRALRRGVPLSVRVGEPLIPRTGDDPGEVTAMLRDVLAALVDEAARDYPVRPSVPHERWWVPAHLGGTAPTTDEARRILAQGSGGGPAPGG